MTSIKMYIGYWPAIGNLVRVLAYHCLFVLYDVIFFKKSFDKNKVILVHLLDCFQSTTDLTKTVSFLSILINMINCVSNKSKWFDLYICKVEILRFVRANIYLIETF